jgi:branched-chain amino acid transport system substrate-binding protein
MQNRIGAAARGALTGDTIRIGEFGSMTGAEATFGQSTHNGIVLAVEEQNATGGVKGKKIELRSYDDQGKTQEAGTAVTRLINQDGVVAIIGEVASSLSIAGGRVAQQYGVPMISPSSVNPQVTQIGDMIFRVCFVAAYQGYVGASFARRHIRARKAAILYDQAQAYSKGLKDDFSRSFTRLGGAVTTEQAYSGGDQDFSAQLTSIRATEPDIIYVPGYYTDVGNISLQARKLGIEVPLLGGDGWDSARLGEIGGAAIEGSYYSNHYSPEEQRPAVQAFVKKYQERFDAVPDALAALGYDAAKVLFDAMGRAPSLDGKDLARAIAETRNFQAVTGVISIDAQRNAQKQAVVVQLKGGRPVYVVTVPPPT